MEWLFNNIYEIIVGVILLFGLGYAVFKFIKNPTNKKKEIILAWLLKAVIETEKLLTSEKGKVKLEHVYALYIKKFPVAGRLMPKEVFIKLVDEALDEMEKILKQGLHVDSKEKDDVNG